MLGWLYKSFPVFGTVRFNINARSEKSRFIMCRKSRMQKINTQVITTGTLSRILSYHYFLFNNSIRVVYKQFTE
jgi:hypothetical protein